MRSLALAPLPILRNVGIFVAAWKLLPWNTRHVA